MATALQSLVYSVVCFSSQNVSNKYLLCRAAFSIPSQSYRHTRVHLILHLAPFVFLAKSEENGFIPYTLVI